MKTTLLNVIAERHDTTSRLDHNGRSISVGSIVSPLDSQLVYGHHQGLVIDPHSRLMGGGCCIAVFFDMEVDQVDFKPYSQLRQTPNIISLGDWDYLYREECKNGPSFLFENDSWKSCPRVILFHPKEIETVGRFSNYSIAKRIFGMQMHRLNEHIECESSQPLKLRFCAHSGCEKQMSQIAMFCVANDVYAIPTCPECFKQFHGKCGDKLPRLKDMTFICE